MGRGGPEGGWVGRQAEWLVWGVGIAISVVLGLRVFLLVGMGGAPAWFWWSVLGSAGFAVLVWRMQASTGGGSLLGGAICLRVLTRQESVGWRHTALPELIALFLMTFAATRFGRRSKAAAGLVDTRERRGRLAAQVAANLGVAGVMAGSVEPVYFVAGLAALAEASADTVASELGQVLGGRTLLITSGRAVTPGTDGGVSLLGTACGVAAAAVVAGVAGAFGAVDGVGVFVVFAAGSAGLVLDSVLGATVERWGWVGNDLVNLLSTAAAAGIAFRAYRLLEPPVPFW